MVALVILYKLLSLELDTHVACGILLSLYLSVTCELINQTVPASRAVMAVSTPPDSVF